MTAGNVDDGKSTLLGRLLYDSKSLFEDQLEALRRASHSDQQDEINLALVTDGLRAEREQGITIDVAYRYFSTPRRKFILADSPGHQQYTRNMVTAASNSQYGILLVDATKGISEQTNRHYLISSLFRVSHLAVCINKMDQVGFAKKTFDQIRKSFESLSKKLDIHDVSFIPISALLGDNVVHRSKNMPWYTGRPLLEHMEEVHIASDFNHVDLRFLAQLPILGSGEFRGYAGKVASGSLRVGEELVVLPSGHTGRVKTIHLGDESLQEAVTPMSVTVSLDKDIDIPRGSVLARPLNRPEVSQDLDAIVCWMSRDKLVDGARLLLINGPQETQCKVKTVHYSIDVNTYSRTPVSGQLELNEIGKVQIRTAQPLVFDSYRKNRATGSFVLVDMNTHDTVAGGVIL